MELIKSSLVVTMILVYSVRLQYFEDNSIMAKDMAKANVKLKHLNAKTVPQSYHNKTEL